MDAITRGLQKRPIAHLDEAYVYLGLAQQKLNDIAQARHAFARLKEVPNVKPRILRLWELYAETLGVQAPIADSSPTLREPTVSAATPTPAAATTSEWVEGRNFRVVRKPVPASLPRAKVLVTELFSYACPACNALQPQIQRLIKDLPPSAMVNYIPVSWYAEREWPMVDLVAWLVSKESPIPEQASLRQPQSDERQ